MKGMMKTAYLERDDYKYEEVKEQLAQTKGANIYNTHKLVPPTAPNYHHTTQPNHMYNVHMYTCTHVHMFTCTHVHMYTCTHALI